MEKISYADYVRICKKTASEKCHVNIGDVVEILDHTYDMVRVGIVLELYHDKMKLLINNSSQWWTRYVKCNIISYNK